MPSLPVLLTRLGQVIRTLREGAGYSQERFGFAIKRHRTYMGLLERGKANPTVKTLHLVAEGLAVSVPELFVLAAGGGGAVSLPEGKRLSQEKGPAKTGGRRKRSIQPPGKPGQKRRKPRK